MSFMFYVALVAESLFAIGLLLCTIFVAYMFFESLFKYKESKEFIVLCGIVTVICTALLMLTILAVVTTCKAL